MQFFYLSLGFTCLAVTSAASNVCDSGIYGILKPLAGVPEAASFCSAKFPTVVTAKKTKRSVTTSTTRTSTTKTSTLSTAAVTVANNRVSSTKTTTTSTKTNTKQQLLASLSACAYNVASTFCSCNFPPKTVQPSPTGTCASPPTPIQRTCNEVPCTDAPAQCSAVTSIDDCYAACDAVPNGGCDVPTYDASTGSCYLVTACCHQAKKHRLARSEELAKRRTWVKKQERA